MRLEDVGFIPLLKEIRLRCTEPFHDNISQVGRDRTEQVRVAVEAYLIDLGWDSHHD